MVTGDKAPLKPHMSRGGGGGVGVYVDCPATICDVTMSHTWISGVRDQAARVTWQRSSP